jgi:hypothetical protein
MRFGILFFKLTSIVDDYLLIWYMIALGQILDRFLSGI